jgi:hypothetical protein
MCQFLLMSVYVSLFYFLTVSSILLSSLTAGINRLHILYFSSHSSCIGCVSIVKFGWIKIFHTVLLQLRLYIDDTKVF